MNLLTKMKERLATPTELSPEVKPGVDPPFDSSLEEQIYEDDFLIAYQERQGHLVTVALRDDPEARRYEMRTGSDGDWEVYADGSYLDVTDPAAQKIITWFADAPRPTAYKER